MVTEAEVTIKNLEDPNSVTRLSNIFEQIDSIRKENFPKIEGQDIIKSIEEDIKKIYLN